MDHPCPMCGYHPGKVDTDEFKLPRRYRKAYRFLLSNIGEPDLRVADLAEAASVCERALQAAWSKYLGCSPSATIRRLRAEKIRYEIVASSKTIAKCAEQFGVTNRLTLNLMFRREFGCTPKALRQPQSEPQSEAA